VPLEPASKNVFQNSSLLVMTIHLWERSSVIYGESWYIHFRDLAAPEKWLSALVCAEDEGTKIFRIFENYQTTTQRHTSEGFYL
jgi:hypothetical protein